MYSVYTISRQYGSGGSKLAIKLAEMSGYQLIWQEIVNQAAAQIGSPDMALAMIDELGLFRIYPDDDTRNKFKEALENVVLSKAEIGNVIIVGRASQLILKNFPNSLHLRIIAGIDTRIQNIHKTKNVSEKAAKAQIEESDRQRMNFIKKMYDKDWNDPTLYDLTINMDAFKPEKIVHWILTL